MRKLDYLWPDRAPQGNRLRLFYVQAIAERHGLPVEAVMGRCRQREYVLARQEAMWVLRNRLGDSLPRIGRLMGRDHTTILHGIRAHEARVSA